MADAALKVGQPCGQCVPGFGRLCIYQSESEASPVPDLPVLIGGQGDEGFDDGVSNGVVALEAAGQSPGNGEPDPGVRVVDSDVVKDELDGARVPGEAQGDHCLGDHFGVGLAGQDFRKLGKCVRHVLGLAVDRLSKVARACQAI